jgi:hypothetical protein
MFCSRERRSLGAAVALLSLLRNEGGSVRASLAQIFNERRDHFHTFRLGGKRCCAALVAGAMLPM